MLNFDRTNDRLYIFSIIILFVNNILLIKKTKKKKKIEKRKEKRKEKMEYYFYTISQRECKISSTMNLVGIFQGKGRMIP